MICSKIATKKHAAKEQDVEFEYMSKGSGRNGSDEERDDLQHSEAFITKSEAFVTLKNELREIVNPVAGTGIRVAQKSNLMHPDQSEGRDISSDVGTREDVSPVPHHVARAVDAAEDPPQTNVDFIVAGFPSISPRTASNPDTQFSESELREDEDPLNGMFTSTTLKDLVRSDLHEDIRADSLFKEHREAYFF
ncbi:hypothetical protein LZ554_000868 [Drepanopeziza brunnea f. sp. 'monogermtubi']|nr:hypothetical protein LZ554_000868 [Drepanopeziza brunnea f. sp. 'monogermtubi']